MALSLHAADMPLSDAAGLTEVVGPRPNVVGYAPAPDRDQPIALPLQSSVGTRGGLMAWLHIDRPYQTGEDPPEHRQGVFMLPGVLDSEFFHYHGMTILKTLMLREQAKPMLKSLELPGLPAGWLHFAVRWDAEAGRLERFVNGTAVDSDRGQQSPWTIERPAERLLLTPGRFAFADVRVSEQPFTDDELRRAVGPLHRGSMDHLLGAREAELFDPESVKGDLLMHWPLTSEQDITGWQVEGKAAKVSIDEQGLRLASEPMKWPDGPLVVWVDQDLPESFVAQWEVQLTEPKALLMVFFGARGRDGQDLFDPSLQERMALFGKYHSGDIDTYHLSYYARGRTTSNLRKNHGFHLVANGPTGIEDDSTQPHQVTLIKQGGHIRFIVDGRKGIDWIDDGQTYGPVLGAGKLGFRQMEGAVARYRNLSIYQLSDGEAVASPVD